MNLITFEQGQGFYKYSNGDTYDGGYQNDRKHGKGTLVIEGDV